MDITRLENLRETIDAVIRSETPEGMAILTEQLESVLAEIKDVEVQAAPESAESSLILQVVKDLWYTAAEPPSDLPGDPQQQSDLADLLSTMLATQRFVLALSRGDLSQSLDVRGIMAGSLKSLQASLRHLTWQTDMIAKGDFGQKVEFMGEFSTSFNSMVSSLANARQQIFEQNEALARINASLMDEIAGRRKVEEKQRQADARAEIQRRLIEQREQERLQVARDLHDGPMQELIALAYSLDSTIQTCTDASIQEELLSMLDMTRKLGAELRAYAGELRPPTLSRFGLKRAIRSHVESFQEKHPELQIELALENEDNPLPEATRLALFRICQESLNNIVKHAKASQIFIRLEADQSLVRLEIEDNGRGFALPDDWLELARKGHLGLVGIRERAEAIGGKVEIWSKPDQGARIRITAPVLSAPS